MPTGYTAKVNDGTITTLKDYALCCLNAFVRNCDDTLLDVTKTLQPDPYHLEKIKEIQDEIVTTLTLTKNDCEISAKRFFEKERCYRERDIQCRQEIRQRYIDMINKINLWQIPEELTKLRDFMLDQLTESKRSDCYECDLPTITKLSGEEWKLQKIQDLCETLIYHTKEWRKECEKTEKDNHLIKTLLESL